MTNAQQSIIISEFRVGFQIPPFVQDSALETLAQESFTWLSAINPKFKDNFEADHIGQSLLKNRMYYCYNHTEYMFIEDYGRDLVTWQMASLEGDADA